jgi:hypothetical protein
MFGISDGFLPALRIGIASIVLVAGQAIAQDQPEVAPPPTAENLTTTTPEADVAIEAAVKTVKFRVAANPDVGVASNDLTGVFGVMNTLISVPDYPPGKDADGASYPGDVACLGLTYQLSGGAVIENDDLPALFVSGHPQYGWDSFTSVVSAEVYVVTSINCNGSTTAAGCGAPGGKRVVTAGTGLDGQVWVHEDGHTHNLPHSNPSPPQICPTDYHHSKESEWRRIMYCRVNDNSKGLTKSECKALGGVSVVFDSPILVADAGGADMAIEAAAAEDENAVPETLAQLLSRPIGEDNEPLPAFKQLSSEELDIVRRILTSGTPLELVLGAVIALGEAGNEADAFLLQGFIESKSLPQNRFINEAKFAALPAIGKIGGRTQSEPVVIMLLQYTQTERAKAAVGIPLAKTVQDQATIALGEGKATALPYIRSLAAASEAAAAGKSLNLEALSTSDIAVLEQMEGSEPLDPYLLGLAEENALSAD